MIGAKFCPWHGKTLAFGQCTECPFYAPPSPPSRLALADMRPLSSLVFRVDGKPQGKQRARRTSRHGRAFIPTETKDYELAVRMAVEQHVACEPEWILDGRYHVGALISFGGARASDIDNIQKSVLDGMNKAAYRDDSRVRSTAFEIIDDDEPYVDITVHAHEALPKVKKPRPPRRRAAPPGSTVLGVE
jgi:Holliday junction resolvase RusA-like endonuclease